MRDSVHYLFPGLGKAHLVRPLTRGEFSYDRVVLVVPNHLGSQSRMATVTKEFLEENVGIDVDIKSVDTNDFATIVATAYDDLVNHLRAEDDVALNVASPYWSLGAGYATAAAYVIAEWPGATELDPEGHLTRPRDHVSLYYTEPERYGIEEVMDITETLANFHEDFTEIHRLSEDLRAEVESDTQTINGLVSLIESGRTEQASLEQMREMIENLGIDDTEESIADGLVEIIRGIESFTTGIDILAKEENQKTLKQLPIPGQLTEVADGLADVSNRTESETDGITPVDFLWYVNERLENVNQVVERIKIHYEDFTGEFERCERALGRPLEDIESEGITAGVRTFDGAQHADYPGPLRFDLSSFRHALIYTLAVDGPADSIHNLTTRLIIHAIDAAPLTDIEIPDLPDVETLTQQDPDATPSLLIEELRTALLSKVQYNLTSLEEDGFITKTKVGQRTSVRLTRAGQVYASAQDFDERWRQVMFEDLCETVKNEIDSDDE